MTYLNYTFSLYCLHINHFRNFYIWNTYKKMQNFSEAKVDLIKEQKNLYEKIFNKK